MKSLKPYTSDLFFPEDSPYIKEIKLNYQDLV